MIRRGKVRVRTLDKLVELLEGLAYRGIPFEADEDGETWIVSIGSPT